MSRAVACPSAPSFLCYRTRFSSTLASLWATSAVSGSTCTPEKGVGSGVAGIGRVGAGVCGDVVGTVIAVLEDDVGPVGRPGQRGPAGRGAGAHSIPTAAETMRPDLRLACFHAATAMSSAVWSVYRGTDLTSSSRSKKPARSKREVMPRSRRTSGQGTPSMAPSRPPRLRKQVDPDPDPAA